MKKFFRELISDNNSVNEKAFVGIISFFMMVLAFLADIITGVMGIKLVIEEFIFNGFLMMTSIAFGISVAGNVFNNNKKEEK